MKNLLLLLSSLSSLASAGTLTISVDASNKFIYFNAVPRAILNSQERDPIYYFINSRNSKVRANSSETQVWDSTITSVRFPQLNKGTQKSDFDAVVVDFGVHFPSSRKVTLAKHCQDTGLIKDTGALYAMGPLLFKNSDITVNFFGLKGNANNYSVDCTVEIKPQ